MSRKPGMNKKKDLLKVIVSDVANVNPSVFYVHLVKERQLLTKLQHDLNQVYCQSWKRKFRFENKIKPGDTCVAYYLPDHLWYRAEIINVDKNTAQVVYLDYGNLGEVDVEDLRKLISPFDQLPFYALKCSLYGISPCVSDGVTNVDTWSSAAKCWFEESLLNKTFSAYFPFRKIRSSMGVSKIVLFYPDLSKTVQDVIVSLGFGFKTEDSCKEPLDLEIGSSSSSLKLSDLSSTEYRSFCKSSENILTAGSLPNDITCDDFQSQFETRSLPVVYPSTHIGSLVQRSNSGCEVFEVMTKSKQERTAYALEVSTEHEKSCMKEDYWDLESAKFYKPRKCRTDQCYKPLQSNSKSKKATGKSEQNFEHRNRTEIPIILKYWKETTTEEINKLMAKKQVSETVPVVDNQKKADVLLSSQQTKYAKLSPTTVSIFSAELLNKNNGKKVRNSVQNNNKITKRNFDSVPRRFEKRFANQKSVFGNTKKEENPKHGVKNTSQKENQKSAVKNTKQEIQKGFVKNSKQDEEQKNIVKSSKQEETSVVRPTGTIINSIKNSKQEENQKSVVKTTNQEKNSVMKLTEKTQNSGNNTKEEENMNVMLSEIPHADYMDIKGKFDRDKSVQEKYPTPNAISKSGELTPAKNDTIAEVAQTVGTSTGQCTLSVEPSRGTTGKKEKLFLEQNKISGDNQSHKKLDEVDASIIKLNEDICPIMDLPDTNSEKKNKSIKNEDLVNKDLVNVVVCDVNDPSFFHVQLSNANETLENLQRELNDFYSETWSKSLSFSTMPLKNTVCASLYVDGEWYRAKIIKFNKKDETILVSYIDYGNICYVKMEDLRHIHCKFFDVPCQAIPCSLHGVAPATHRSGVVNETGWSEFTVSWFDQHTLGKEFSVKFHDTSDRNTTEVTLYYTDLPQSDVKLKSVADTMVVLGHANFDNETLGKVNTNESCLDQCQAITKAKVQCEENETYSNTKSHVSLNKSPCESIHENELICSPLVVPPIKKDRPTKQMEVESNDDFNSFIFSEREEVDRSLISTTKVELPSETSSPTNECLDEFKTEVSDTNSKQTSTRTTPTKPPSTPTDDMVKVKLSMVENPFSFQIQIEEDQSSLDRFQQELNLFYSQPWTSRLQFKDFPSYGTRCVALCSEVWYRAFILGFQSSTSVKVHLLDYGRSKTVNKDDICPISSQFTSEPPFSIHCCLYGIQPYMNDWDNTNNILGISCTSWFQYHTDKHEIMAQFIPLPDEDNPVCTQLYFSTIDQNGNKLLWNISHIMMLLGLARIDQDITQSIKLLDENIGSSSLSPTSCFSKDEYSVDVLKDSGENENSFSNVQKYLADSLPQYWNPMAEDFNSNRNNYATNTDDACVAVENVDTCAKICKYYQKGDCWRGDKCAWEHIPCNTQLLANQSTKVLSYHSMSHETLEADTCAIVRVIMLLKDRDFYAHVIKKSTTNFTQDFSLVPEKLLELTKDMKTYYSKNRRMFGPVAPTCGEMFVVIHELTFCRVAVLQLSSFTSIRVKVYLVDYGTTLWLNTDKLLPMVEAFIHLPAQAVHCTNIFEHSIIKKVANMETYAVRVWESLPVVDSPVPLTLLFKISN
uniref:uncharacterized protein LOC100178786 isoform X2 n=1 Tax=Ciona intestinalis TaxID=7719 RepID=UPI000EF495C7|nr:uncharacterized protein LOC100178786 isoform X2 [Ciona intestinalis]|eukprot:XP_018670844.2 uncharacterized protein LOC100178786 isoform X2 [Ciona intestinalis]